MTKSERERVVQLELGIRLAKAMRWPEYARPSSLTKAEIETVGGPSGVARGWFANTYDRGSVSYGCSNGVNHNSDGDKTSTQGMGRMYATEADAWRAIRVEMTERFAGILARIDEKLAGGEASGSTPDR